MIKYELLPQQLIRLGIVDENTFFEPSEGYIYDLSIHDASYLNRLLTVNLSRKEERASGFEQSLGQYTEKQNENGSPSKVYCQQHLSWYH